MVAASDMSLSQHLRALFSLKLDGSVSLNAKEFMRLVHSCVLFILLTSLVKYLLSESTAPGKLIN
jgi:hypothetical protein